MGLLCAQLSAGLVNATPVASANRIVVLRTRVSSVVFVLQ
ncbi:activation/secretion domain protein [Ralstonia insidiosa]|uniref:Activation/secretion domain protein n=1 Tax=Ralstonia insidiosa TaxID=190721 RepID=A0AAC9BNJ2_9RALS|nr:activation/secretion domain protein [Ralstonia insidiosa]